MSLEYKAVGKYLFTLLLRLAVFDVGIFSATIIVKPYLALRVWWI